MKRMKVCVITGTRAEFGIWTHVLAAIRSSRLLELQLVVTGMHLQRDFGYTIKDVERAGFPIAARVPMYRKGRSAAEDLAQGVRGLATAYRQLKPAIVLVLGDRLEMLAAASAALAERIPLGHVHGGETAPGQWDEQIRHALTKMSHVHFCATRKAAERIARMGEEKKYIHVTGAPALDGILHRLPALQRFIPRQRRALVLLHPTDADERIEERRAAMMLEALRRLKLPLTVIGPNNDPGHQGILRAYERAGVEFAPSLPAPMFWQEMLRAAVLAGNSSSGIIEAANFALPVVNIGDRQAGRQRNRNVIDVGWNSGASGIARALRRALQDRHFLRNVSRRQNLYGDGHAAQRIAAVLEKIARTGIPLEKRFAD